MRWRRLLVALALAGLVGCGSDEDRIKLVPVTGTVTLNGKPLADAMVNFVPAEASGPSTPGVDSTGPMGNYKLMFKGRSGVAPGKYKVTITPADETASAANVPEAFKDDPAMLGFANDARQKSGSKGPAGTKTEFDAEVPAEGGVLDFDVKSGKPAKS